MDSEGSPEFDYESLEIKTVAVHEVARYTVSAGELVAGSLLLGVGLVHVVVGVPTALLPVLGGLGLLAAGIAIAPVIRRRFRQHASLRDDLILAAATLLIGAVCLLAFGWIGTLS